ncbi:unnamed protein product [Camellia sinensis]
MAEDYDSVRMAVGDLINCITKCEDWVWRLRGNDCLFGGSVISQTRGEFCICLITQYLSWGWMQENLKGVIPKLYALAFASSCLDTEHTKNVALDISIFSFLGVMQHGLVFVKCRSFNSDSIYKVRHLRGVGT